MSSGDFNNLALRNTTSYNPDGSFVSTGYVFTVSTNGRQLWTNNLNLGNLSVSTLQLNSTLTLNTSIVNQLTVNSTAVVSSITSGGIINYSTLTGSTITANTGQFQSTLTASSLAVSGQLGASSLVVSSMTSNNQVVNSTLTVSSLIGVAGSFSTLSVSSLTSNNQVVNSTLTVSSLIGVAGSFSTLSVSSMTSNNQVVNSTLTVSSLIGVAGSFSTLSALSTLIGNESITSTLVVGSTVVVPTALVSTLVVSSLSTTSGAINATLGVFSTLSVSTLSTSGGVLTMSAGSFSTLAVTSQLNANNTWFSTMTGSTIALNTLSAASSIVASSVSTGFISTFRMVVSSIVDYQGNPFSSTGPTGPAGSGGGGGSTLTGPTGPQGQTAVWSVTPTTTQGPLTKNTNTLIAWGTTDNTQTTGITGLSYAAGQFTNNTTLTMPILVEYALILDVSGKGSTYVSVGGSQIGANLNEANIVHNSCVFLLAPAASFGVYYSDLGTPTVQTTSRLTISLMTAGQQGPTGATGIAGPTGPVGQVATRSATADGTQSITGGALPAAVLFDTPDAGQSTGNTGLTYAAGLFTNSTSVSLPVLVEYTIYLSSGSLGGYSFVGVNGTTAAYGGLFNDSNWFTNSYTVLVPAGQTVAVYYQDNATVTVQTASRIRLTVLMAGGLGATGQTGMSLWQANGTNVYYTAGPVGIGTSSATASLGAGSNLDVTGLNRMAINGLQHVEMNSNGANTSYIDFHSQVSTLTDYDSRIVTTGGSTIAGYGNVQYLGGSHSFLNGAVGIGTTNPSNTLQIVGDTKIGYSSSSAYLINLGSAGTLPNSTINSRAAYIYSIGQHMEINNQQGGGSIVFSPGNTEAMRITATGNVGIGTAGPTALLHVQGVNSGATQPLMFLKNSADATNTGASLRFGTFGSSSPSNPAAEITAVCTDGSFGITDLAFSTYNYSGSALYGERMRITAAGNVGIGITNPSQRFEVRNAGAALDAGAVYTQSYFYTGYSANNPVVAYKLGWYSDDWSLRAHRGSSTDVAAFTISRNGTEWFHLESSGIAILNYYTTNGTVTTINSIGQLSVSSDRRIKNSIVYQTDTTAALDQINHLKPAVYKMNGSEDLHLGFIAQDIEEHIPLAVDGKKYEWKWEINEDGSPKMDADGKIVYQLDSNGEKIIRPRGVSDRALIAVQTLAIQQLTKDRDTQQQRIQALEAQQQVMTEQINALLAKQA